VNPSLLPAPWKASITQDTLRRGPWFAPVASAIVPGAGQLMRGEDRGAIYFIAEAFLLQRFISLWTASHREEDRYRELAIKIARAPFAPTLRDTVFEYFEQMGRYVESGPFDTDPGSRLVPPTDESTYNGAIWGLARRTYFSGTTTPPDTSVTYQSALAFYRRRAIGPGFQWSWQSLPAEQDLFRQTIKQGDDNFRQATRQLGLLLANRFLSAVDAFVSEKLSHRARGLRLDHQVWLRPEGGSPRIALQVGLSF
jgi:hypothetical protein